MHDEAMHISSNHSHLRTPDYRILPFLLRLVEQGQLSTATFQHLLWVFGNQNNDCQLYLGKYQGVWREVHNKLQSNGTGLGK